MGVHAPHMMSVYLLKWVHMCTCVCSMYGVYIFVRVGKSVYVCVYMCVCVLCSVYGVYIIVRVGICTGMYSVCSTYSV